MDESSETLFPAASEAVRVILDEVRRVVRETLPEASEGFYHGALGYGSTPAGADRILYLVPQNGYVNLGFFFATSAPDPTGLLEGSGTRMRHVKVRSLAAAREPALRTLVRAAWAPGVAAFAQARASRKKPRPRA